MVLACLVKKKMTFGDLREDRLAECARKTNICHAGAFALMLLSRELKITGIG
jgi:hypothetical protein